MNEVIEKLKAPFPPEKIHWRLGSTNARAARAKGEKCPTKGIPLAYLDARDIMERLDEVVGPENWQSRFPRDGCCELSIRLNGEWITKTDGAGQTDIEGEKGQYSTALKRAAVNFGIGRYLYDLPNVWVDLEKGRLSESTKQDLTARLSKWQENYFNKGNK